MPSRHDLPSLSGKKWTLYRRGGEKAPEEKTEKGRD